MIVGVPAETKKGENRVAITPDGVRELVHRGHVVRVERGAGAGSSIHDDDLAAAGATLVDVDEAWGAELVVKVKEPQGAELARLRPDLVLFTYLQRSPTPCSPRARPLWPTRRCRSACWAMAGRCRCWRR